eukprot:gene24984-biopygen23953
MELTIAAGQHEEAAYHIDAVAKPRFPRRRGSKLGWNAAPQAPPKGKVSGNVAPQAPPGLAQACNAPTRHMAVQNTSLQWHSTLGLVQHLMRLTADGLIDQSQIAAKCTNSAAGTTKLNETASNSPKYVGLENLRRKRQEIENSAPKAPELLGKLPLGIGIPHTNEGWERSLGGHKMTLWEHFGPLESE